MYDITFFIPGSQRPEDAVYRYIPISDLNYKLIVMTNPIRPLSPEVSRFLGLVKEELGAASLQP